MSYRFFLDQAHLPGPAGPFRKQSRSANLISRLQACSAKPVLANCRARDRSCRAYFDVIGHAKVGTNPLVEVRRSGENDYFVQSRPNLAGLIHIEAQQPAVRRCALDHFCSGYYERDNVLHAVFCTMHPLGCSSSNLVIQPSTRPIRRWGAPAGAGTTTGSSARPAAY